MRHSESLNTPTPLPRPRAPTPLPRPLAPHDADDEPSVVESQIRRYPLEANLPPGESVPDIPLPANLPPIQDDLLGHSRGPGNISERQPRPGAGPAPLSRAPSEEDIITEVRHPALSAPPDDQSAVPRPSTSGHMRTGGQDSEQVTTPISVPAVAEPPEDDKAAGDYDKRETGKLRRSGAEAVRSRAATEPPASSARWGGDVEANAEHAAGAKGAPEETAIPVARADKPGTQPYPPVPKRILAPPKGPRPQSHPQRRRRPTPHTGKISAFQPGTGVSPDDWNDETTSRHHGYRSNNALSSANRRAASGGAEAAPGTSEQAPDGASASVAPGLDAPADKTFRSASNLYIEEENTEINVDLGALPRRPDGLPQVIHDDMELGDAFHVALLDDDGAGPLGEVRAPLSIFSSLPKAAVSDLAEHMTLRHFSQGEYVLCEGEPSEACYVVVSGKVSVLRKNPFDSDSESREIIQLGDGSLFGEFALLANRRRRASVRAAEDCSVYEIPRRLLRELAASYTEVGPLLDRIYRDRLVASMISAVPYMRNLLEVEVADLRGRFEVLRYESDEPVIREGSRSGGLYIIAIGAVEITRRLSGKRSALLATLPEGAYFADMALAVGQSAGASVNAAGPTELIALSPEDFFALIEKNPGMWNEIVERGRRPDLEKSNLLTGDTYLT